MTDGGSLRPLSDLFVLPMGVFVLSIAETLADGLNGKISTVRCFRYDLLPKVIVLPMVLDISMTLKDSL